MITSQSALHYSSEKVATSGRNGSNVKLSLYDIKSGVMATLGTTMIFGQSIQWASSGFGSLNDSSSKRWTIPAVGMIALSVQCAASSFLLSVLRMAGLKGE